MVDASYLYRSYGMAGGMTGGARRGRGSSESVCKMVFTLTSDERCNCQVTTRKQIARERIPRILRVPNS